MDHNNLLAQVQFQIPDYQGNVLTKTSATTQFENIISLAITVLSIVAVIFFTIQIILAGYSFMTSKGDPKNMETARASLTQNILGLTITVIAVGLASLIASLLGLGNVFHLNTLFNTLGL